MTRRTRIVAALTVALAAAAAVLWAAPSAPPRPEPEARGTDLLPSRQALRLSRARPVASAAAPTVDDVGDPDSFGRNLRWLGLAQANVVLDPVCDPAVITDPCTVVSPTATTNFSFVDAARIVLPAKATRSLMCYWFSPYLTVTYTNPGTTAAVSWLRYNPTLTIENPVLDDPALINPQTGLPFGGRLTSAMTASEMFQVPLPPGMSVTERSRDSAVCIAGFVHRRMLTDTFGLTPAQADEFYKKPTTVRLNISGQVRGVSEATLIFGLRIIGD